MESGEAPFCLSADIKAAHRLVKIRESDWGFMCCRADSSSDVIWVNKTGTFGVSSAPYWWAKLCALIGRFVGHLMQTSWFLHMIYVDDLHGVFVGERKFLNLWIWLLAFEMAGTPFGYHKFTGGFASEFVGFHLRYDHAEVGVSEKRGSWLVQWIKDAEANRWVVQARSFTEFLGRLSFVAQLLVWIKPHLAPLFAWSAVVGSGMVGRLPDTIILTLKYLLAEFGLESFRVSVLFRKGSGAQWASTSAELLASLAGLHAFGWLAPSQRRKSAVVALSAGTDNQANEALSVKRSSTKWPLMAVNMQLSSSLAKARLSLRLKWRPRDENQEADDLTNELFEAFDPADRVVFTLQDMDLSIIQELVRTRAAFDVARAEAKAAKGSGRSGPTKRFDKSS